jgi:hypothetical protein
MRRPRPLRLLTLGPPQPPSPPDWACRLLLRPQRALLRLLLLAAASLLLCKGAGAGASTFLALPPQPPYTSHPNYALAVALAFARAAAAEGQGDRRGSGRLPSLGSTSAMPLMHWPVRLPRRSSSSSLRPPSTLGPPPPAWRATVPPPQRSSSMIQPIHSWCSFTTRPRVFRTSDCLSRSSSTSSRLPTPQDGNGAIPAGFERNVLFPDWIKTPRSPSPSPPSGSHFPRPRPRTGISSPSGFSSPTNILLAAEHFKI